MKLKILLAFIVLTAGTASAFGLDFDLSEGRVAMVSLSGAIQPSSSGFGPEGITPQSVRNLNERAKNQKVDAIVYEINSGGGAVVASKEVMREIESVEVPTVCRFRDVAASGAYLASLGCDSIVSDSTSLTGSIGVRGSYLEFSGLMRRLGIEYVNISSGKYKQLGSPYINASGQNRELLQEKSEKVHEEFLSLVNTSRGLDSQQMREVRTGEPFLGSEAKELGLVDRMGGRETAIKEAERLSDKELETLDIEQRKGFSFLSLLTGSISLPNFISWDAPLKAVY